MAKGDHIYRRMKISAGFTTHHGIDCGDGTVIHYHGVLPNIMVRRVSMSEFADGEKISTQNYSKCDSPDVVVQRAISKLGEKNYNLFSNNCEHFAHYCKTSYYRSEQANKGIAGVAGVAGESVIGWGIKAASHAAKPNLNPISKALVNMGLKQAPRAAGRVAGGIAGVGGLAAGIVTDLVVEKLLEDDQHLLESEREARKNGRDACKIGTIAGGVAAGVAGVAIGGSAAVAAAVAAPAVLGVGAAMAAYHLSKNDESRA